MKKEERYELIERYLLNKADEAERSRLEALIASDPSVALDFEKHKRLIERLKHSNRLQGLRQKMRNQRDVSAAQVPPKRVLPLFRILLAVAGVALLICVLWWLIDRDRPQQLEEWIAMEEFPEQERGTAGTTHQDRASEQTNQDTPTPDEPYKVDETPSSMIFAAIELDMQMAIRSNQTQIQNLKLTAQVMDAGSAGGHVAGNHLRNMETLLLAGDHASALNAGLKAHKLLANNPQTPPGVQLALLNNLALAYEGMGDPIQADLYFREALEMLAQPTSGQELRYTVLLFNRAVSFHRLGNKSRAETLYKEVRDGLEAQEARPKHVMLGLLQNMARLYQDMDRDDEASTLLEEAQKYTED